MAATLGEVFNLSGRIEEAVTNGQRALHLARQFGQRSTEARTLYLLGSIFGYGASSNANQARESYQQALVLTHKLGMRPLEAQCHLALGELAKKAGERSQAQVCFGTSLSMFREMDMRPCLEKVESGLGEL